MTDEAQIFTAAELAREAERETALRVNVYGQRVAAGKMTKNEAARRIGMMREIARRLRDAAEAKRLF
jgi:hypothetical protein